MASILTGVAIIAIILTALIVAVVLERRRQDAEMRKVQEAARDALAAMRSDQRLDRLTRETMIEASRTISPSRGSARRPRSSVLDNDL